MLSYTRRKSKCPKKKERAHNALKLFDFPGKLA
jgi:hypothetical protein